LKIELINTGSELLLGRTLNTHAQWLARQLADRGCVVTRQCTVADTSPAIAAAVRESLGRADLVITTGGLGPTSDDLTRQVLAEMLGRKLHEDPAIVAHIQHRFAERKRPMPPSTRVQALVPEGALVLPNPNGTAPGLALELKPNPLRAAGTASWLILLPGPPRELRPMFAASVLPLLEKIFPDREPVFSRTLRTVGLGESLVEERIAPKLQRLVSSGLQIGYCAHMGQVDVRLEARGAGRETIVDQAEGVVRGEVGDQIFGEGDELLEAVIVRLLTGRKQTLALAESCTGGFIANKITNIPGASAVLLAGLVTYANAAKEKFLGVRAATLAAHGAVSEAVVREMAEGARHETGADFAIAVTGIAGPGGGTAEKPVGTVFIALASARGTKVEQRLNLYERETFKELTARQALELLRQAVRAS
jgi:nicotinamide-nucleotide amidase